MLNHTYITNNRVDINTSNGIDIRDDTNQDTNDFIDNFFNIKTYKEINNSNGNSQANSRTNKDRYNEEILESNFLDDFNIFKLISEVEVIKTHKDELISIPKLETKIQRLNVLKHWCYKLGAEGFDTELALESLNRNKHLFRYRSSAIWAIWLYCNYIPREKLDIEFIWLHYLFNNICRLKEPTQAFVWLELMSHSTITPHPLPLDINKLIDSGIIYKVDLTNNIEAGISTLTWAISDTELALSSMSKKKLTKYLVEGIGSTWDHTQRL